MRAYSHCQNDNEKEYTEKNDRCETHKLLIPSIDYSVPTPCSKVLFYIDIADDDPVAIGACPFRTVIGDNDLPGIIDRIGTDI